MALVRTRKFWLNCTSQLFVVPNERQLPTSALHMNRNLQRFWTNHGILSNVSKCFAHIHTRTDRCRRGAQRFGVTRNEADLSHYMSFTMASTCNMKTSIYPVDIHRLGRLTAVAQNDDILDDFELELDPNSEDAKRLLAAARDLRTSDVPVAFPTETVYGLGADATRSNAVRGIYRAKQRPADNPLIVHFASLSQLRRLLGSAHSGANGTADNDSIPAIYRSVISKFWPGPLTIILPNPRDSPLAPEVTAGLTTFGARIPRHALALALIKLADVPVAAPSANASTKPSPTAAEHVAHDLDGRVQTILDGGPCDVGVESTVVDGMSNPPAILRPGGISIEQLRSCPGWENTQIGYKNVAESGHQPRAPGMKYRHYSPKAPVVLYEAGKNALSAAELSGYLGQNKRIGVITTKSWVVDAGNSQSVIRQRSSHATNGDHRLVGNDEPGFAGMLKSTSSKTNAGREVVVHRVHLDKSERHLLEVPLGHHTADIARGVFRALRELDGLDVDAIVVEGIDDSEGDTAAAIMNRLRKAAELKLTE